jgi:hypothetical protein
VKERRAHFGRGERLAPLHECQTAAGVEDVAGGGRGCASGRGPHGEETFAGARLSSQEGVLGGNEVRASAGGNEVACVRAAQPVAARAWRCCASPRTDKRSPSGSGLRSRPSRTERLVPPDSLSLTKLAWEDWSERLSSAFTQCDAPEGLSRTTKRGARAGGGSG